MSRNREARVEAFFSAVGFGSEGGQKKRDGERENKKKTKLFGHSSSAHPPLSRFRAET